MTKRSHGFCLSVILFWPAFVAALGGAAAACDPPFGLSSLNISTDRATLTWTHAAPAVVSAYELEIRPIGLPFSGAATHKGIAAPPFLLTGLESGKTYRCKVRAICGTDTSAWSATTHSFRTVFSNPARCGDAYALVDNLCPAPASQIFPILVQNPGAALGQDFRLRAVRLVVDHTWRSDLIINLKSPDGTTVRLIEGLNAGDTSLGNPTLPCPNYLELSNDPGALPLGALYKVSYPTGRYQPRNPLAAFNNGQNPNGIWRLDICDQRAGKEGAFRWAELVFENLNCPAPLGVFVQNIGLTSAEIGWPTDTLGCDSLLVEWGLQGFLPGDGAAAGSGSMGFAKMACPASFPLTINDLTPLRWHDVYLRRHCDGGIWSANSEPLRFFTDCAPTLAEDFEGQNICDKTCDAPCPLAPGGIWQNASAGDDFDWKIWQGATPSAPNTGAYTDANGRADGKYLYFETTCPPNGVKDSTAALRSHCIQVNAAAGQACHFAFDYFMWNTSTAASAYGKLLLDISLNGGLTWANLLTISGIQPKGWRHISVPLGQYDGQIAVFRFVAVGAVSQNADILLDNLRFYGSTDAGAPDYVFYADADGDGHGDPAQPLVRCSPDAPPGYVSSNDDCDDANPEAFPSAPEMRCNGADENCNGMADDAFIPAPTARDTTVCSGQSLVFQAVKPSVGQFFWFEKLAGGLPLAVGATLDVPNLTSTTTFYLADSISAGGCSSARVPVTATANPTPILLLERDTAVCAGLSFNLASLPVLDLAAAGGVFSYHTAFPPDPTNRLTGPLIFPMHTSIYYLAATTSAGCRGVADVKIEVRPSPVATITTGDSTTICRNGFKKLTAYGTGGEPPYSFAWSNGLNFQSIDVQGNTSGTGPAIYTVVVADAHGCFGADFVKVQTLNSVTQTEKTAVHDITNCGGSDGSITLTPLNGQPPYRFDWTGATVGSLVGVASSGTLSNLPQGNYRVTVTDATPEGCSMVMPLIVLNAPGLRVGLDTLRHPACAGDESGEIVLDVQGIAPTFHWSSGQTTQNLAGIGPGSYSVTIADGNCQQVLSDLELTAPQPLSVLANKITPVSCFGGDDGALDIAIFGGTAPHQISWSNAAASEDLDGLSAGTFTAQVTDAHGCETTRQFIVNQPTALVLSAESVAAIRCFGGAEGAVLAQASGGTGGYAYHWSTGANTPYLNNLPAGNYSLTATDVNGCTKNFALEVAQPPVLAFGQIRTQNPLCIGAKNGSIAALPTGGTPGYNYSWSTGQTTQSIDNLDIGTYALTVTDANGCQIFSEKFPLTAPQIMEIALDSLVPVRCFGETSGLIAISVAGGQVPFATKWNQHADDFLLENAPFGPYMVVVTDAQGCTASRFIDLSQPPNPLNISVLAQGVPACYGEFNGFIETAATGGWLPYTFQWSGGQQSESISELPGGIYGLTVTDAEGCTATTGLLDLAQPTEIQALVYPKNIPCNGSEGAILTQQLAGGEPPYRFNWNTGDTTASIFGLSAGFFSLTISDAAGCEAEFDSLKVADSNLEFAIEPLAIEDVSCHGFADGKIAVHLTGGAAPFRLSWGHLPGQLLSADALDTLTGLAPGAYELVALDASGCLAQSEVFKIQQSPALVWQPAHLVDVRCKGAATGQIAPNVAGGLPPYALVWSGNANPDSLRAGTYTATVTDTKGCALVSPSLEITEPPTALAVAADSIWDDNCGPCRGAIFVHAMGGLPQYTYSWSDGGDAASNHNLCPGMYALTVADQNGCTQVVDFEILDAPNPLGVAAVIHDVLCFGDSTGSILVAPSGGTANYQVAWSNGAVGPFLEHLPGGNYDFSVTDGAGCTIFNQAVVHAPDAPLAALAQADSLAGGWSLSLNISGGTGSYSIDWLDAQEHPIASPTGLPSGVYFAEITDGAGCQLRLRVVAGSVGASDLPAIFREIGLAPNPTTGSIWLEIALERPLALTVELLSATGARLAAPIFVEKVPALRLPIDLSSQPPGFIFLKITTETGECRLLRGAKI